MNIATGILVFVIAWWLVFFMLLPIGVRSHEEDGEEVVPGTVESAPTRPNLLKKALGATLIATVIWGAFYYADLHNLVSFRN